MHNTLINVHIKRDDSLEWSKVQKRDRENYKTRKERNF